MGTAIEIASLSKIFRGKRGVHVAALSDLTFAVDAGEVFGFLGPNGAGKSTTIKILMGLLSPSGGDARLCGEPVGNAAARRRVGYLPENPAIYEFLSAEEYLRFVGMSFGMSRKALEQRSAEVLSRLDMVAASRRPIRSYSKGMVQRLGLAQAMLHDPEIYVLDEPMSGLDPIGRSLVKQIIRELKEQGKTVFFSTHITADVEALCDRLGVIVRGRLESLNRVEEVLKEGVEGYSVQVVGGADALRTSYRCSLTSGQVSEYDVPKDRLNAFVETVASGGGSIELIETRRRDLEEFFLKIVQHAQHP